MSAAPVVTYRVLDIPHIVDGDTLWVVRERVVGRMHGMRMQDRRLIGEAQNVALWAVPDVVSGHGMMLVEQDYAGGRKVRLHDGFRGLNTPESKTNKLGWAAARHNLTELLGHWQRDGLALELVTFGIDSFGRQLGDLRPIGDVDSSAVFHMIDLGWEAYK